MPASPGVSSPAATAARIAPIAFAESPAFRSSEDKIDMLARLADRWVEYDFACSHVAALGRVDDSFNHRLGVVPHQLFGEERRLMARALGLAGIAGPARQSRQAQGRAP